MQIDRRVVDLDINDVLPNRFQPRIKFNEISIQELSDSIKKYGVIQPIVVRKIGDKYEIIAGERRYKASVMAGKTTIPAIISDLNDKDSVEIALIENVQREDLTPIEKAISYRKILDMGYMNQEELAEKIGKSQSAIANTLRLLTLSEEVQEALLEVKISERHARSLLKLKNEKDQVKMLNRIINERLTVRRTDEEIEKMMFDEEPIRIDDDANTNVPFQNVPLEQPSQPEILPINEVPTTPVYDVQEEPSLVDVPVTPIYEAPEVPMYEPYTEPVQETYETPEVPMYEPYTEPVQETYETPEVPKYEPNTEPVQETYETPEVPMYEPSTEPVQETYETPEVPKYEPSTEPVQETYETPEVPMYEPSTEPVQESEYDIPTDLSNNSFTDLNLPDFETDTEQNNEYSDMPSFMNISQIEKNAEDIIKPEKPLVDMDELLKPDANMPAIENNQDDESESDNGEILKPGKFFNFFDNEENIDEPKEQVSTNQFDLNNFYTEDNNAQTDEVRNEEQPASVPTNNTYVANDIKTGINTIHDCIKTLEKYGFKVNMEELDLNDKYQIMLDIDKK